MKKLGRELIIIAVAIFVTIFFVSCKEIWVTDNSYDPSFILSGNVEKVVKYMPVEELGIEDKRIELSDVLENVTPLGKIQKLLILTHGSKSIVINSASIPFYYIVVNPKGLVRLYTTIEAHNQTGIFPMISLSEIVVISDEGSGLEHVYDGKSISVNYLTFLRTNGLLSRGGEATEGDCEISLFFYNHANVTNILQTSKTAILHFEDGSSFSVNKESSQFLKWSNGGLQLTGGTEKDIPKSHIVQFEFPKVDSEVDK